MTPDSDNQQHRKELAQLEAERDELEMQCASLQNTLVTMVEEKLKLQELACDPSIQLVDPLSAEEGDLVEIREWLLADGGSVD